MTLTRGTKTGSASIEALTLRFGELWVVRGNRSLDAKSRSSEKSEEGDIQDLDVGALSFNDIASGGDV